MSTQSGRLIKRQTARLCGSLLAAISLLLAGPFFSTQTVIATPSATTETSDPYANVPESISTSIEPSTSPVVGSYFRVEAISHIENYYSKECFLQKKDASGHFEKVESFDTYSDYYSSTCVIASKEVDPEDAGSYRIVMMDSYTQSPLAKSAEFTISPEPIKFLDDKDSFEVPAISGWRAAEDETPHLQVATNANYTKWEKLSGPTINLYGAYNGNFPNGLSEGTYQFKVTAYTSDKYSISRTVTVNAIKTEDPWILKSDGKTVKQDYLYVNREATVDVDPQKGGSSWNLWGAPAGKELQLLKENLKGAFTLPQGSGDWVYRIDSLGPRGTVLRSFEHKVTWLTNPVVEPAPSLAAIPSESTSTINISAPDSVKAYRLFLEAAPESSNDWIQLTELSLDSTQWSGKFSGKDFKGTGKFKLRFKAVGSNDQDFRYSPLSTTEVYPGTKVSLPKKKILARAGSDLTVTASVENASTVSWQSCDYSTYVYICQNTTIGSGESYTFKHLAESDTGTYSVVATGLGSGNTASEDFYLYVAEKDFQFGKPNTQDWSNSDWNRTLWLGGPEKWDVEYWEFKAEGTDTWVRIPDSAKKQIYINDYSQDNSGQYRFVVNEDFRSEPLTVHTDFPDHPKVTPLSDSPSSGGGGGAFFLLLIPLLLAAAIWFTPLRGMLGL